MLKIPKSKKILVVACLIIGFFLFNHIHASTNTIISQQEAERIVLDNAPDRIMICCP